MGGVDEWIGEDCVYVAGVFSLVLLRCRGRGTGFDGCTCR